MGQYGCVVPIDWWALNSKVLPLWAEVLDARKSPGAFAAEFGVDRPGSKDWRAFPQPYLDDIGWDGRTLPFDSDGLRESSVHRRAEELECGYEGTVLFGTAAIARTAVDLGERDEFANTPWDGYYSRLHRPPHVQVAGTKNRFHFLETFFEVAPGPDQEQAPFAPRYWTYRRRLHHRPFDELLERLFLGFRSIPGTRVLPVASAWPMPDDEWIAGYLLPNETRELAASMGRIAEQIDPSENGHELFLMFSNRVQRAARLGCGLMACHGFLF